MSKQRDPTRGEGNPEAAAEFNSAEQAFVQSSRGKQKIKEGPQVRPEEESELAKAEAIGRKHAKDDDSQAQR
jgi:hypothetical protein